MTATPRPPRTRKHWRTVLRAAGLVALLPIVATHLPSPVAWSRGCTDVATGHQFPVNAVDHPYGTVRSCQVLDSHTDLFRDAHNSVSLLLNTDAGWAAVRVDYRNISLGRQYRAEAVELTVMRTPNLFPAEARQLQRSIDGRGGVRTQVWVAHYGDG